MNKNLTKEIVHHIFSGLGVAPNSLANNIKFESIKSKKYLLSEKLSFLDEDQNNIKNHIWGAQLFVDKQNLKILLGDCATDSEVLEYAAVVHLQDSPTYGMYLNYNLTSSNQDYNPLIAVSMDGVNYMACNNYLQATFLAAMENVKNFQFNWGVVEAYQAEHKSLLSFIKYYDKFYEEEVSER